ncbi:PREDICTED: integrator complex subunit 12-like [Priapulus caudatus]|uniref:Integrator complex subunit 12 n=1 Tax=Priapulus caudatus TaxID=37621 RepID=A0ABM1E7N4_PRICU|nr:PREDICTED: integrator complex subunit 12-like [Priapulus caudatus]
MSIAELDPLFSKALRLMRSKSKDSTEQLRRLYDEVVSSRRVSKPGKHLEGKDSKEDLTPTPSKSESSHSTKESKDTVKTHTKSVIQTNQRNGMLRKTFDKLSKDIQELNQEASPAKKARVEQRSPKDLPDDPLQGLPDDTDAGDFAMEMGLACVACRGIDVASGNQLVECQECHSLYHQLCHKPSVTDQEVNDPRNIWNCARCMKMLKKISKSGKESNGNSSSGNSRDSSSSLAASKTSAKSSSKPELLQAFKRTEIKDKTSVSGGIASSGTPLQGLAALAANLGGKSTSKSSQSSSLKSTTKTSASTGSLSLSSKAEPKTHGMSDSTKPPKSSVHGTSGQKSEKGTAGKSGEKSLSVKVGEKAGKSSSEKASASPGRSGSSPKASSKGSGSKSSSAKHGGDGKEGKEKERDGKQKESGSSAKSHASKGEKSSKSSTSSSKSSSNSKASSGSVGGAKAAQSVSASEKSKKKGAPSKSSEKSRGK